ncbi:hypothetical protein CTAYLR_002488 [Chrysophaeum taylorii]|uniref:glucan 1,3-beta-glucosidase n=1 Tax=Chrysophaeum taylorii TaxID=2483200 RepID=A0AAD7UGH4_9STRA|nr:hypothetical protein CTAYLR_002488 [Chrysophaeum taylorii]
MLLLFFFFFFVLGVPVSAQTSLKIRGVNLGGWLVLEKWIKPSLFAEWDPFDPTSPKDEWTYCERLGKSECQKRLDEHWDTWVSVEEMNDLADAGITHVRVPVGWWITGDVEEGEPYVSGQWKYFARMTRWARERGIEVWLDLHAVPGSQNGFDNSGRLGNATWDASTRNVNRSLAAIETIVRRVDAEGLRNDVTGFGLLNEPDQHIDYWLMLDFYNKAYDTIRTVLGDGISIYIGDMFSPQSFNWFWHAGNPIRATNVFLDSHIYACFVDDLKAMTPKQHVTQVCRFERAHINQCCWDGWPPQPTELSRFVGEWTAAYDQTPSPELELASPESRPLTDDRKRFLLQYVIAQMVTFEATPEESAPYLSGAPGLDFHGWFFWNFRMEADVYREWDYLRGVREGWIPKLERNVDVSDQLGLTCEDLEQEAQDCTDGVVSPFPPIPGWTGVPCAESPPRRVLAQTILSALALFSFMALLAALLILARANRLLQKIPVSSRRLRRAVCFCCPGDYDAIKQRAPDDESPASSSFYGANAQILPTTEAPISAIA